MNHVYRRIWNATRQCWVVASELTAAKGKASRVCCNGLLLGALLPTVALAAAETSVEGEETARAGTQMTEAEPGREPRASSTPQATLPSADAIFTLGQAWGISSYSGPIYNPARSSSVLIVDSAFKGYSYLGHTLVFAGSRSTLHGHNSVAYGIGINAIGDNVTALGNGINATGDNATAVGINAVSTGGYATAVGAAAQAQGLGATAFGNGARADKTNAVAIGSGARAWSANSVAIGANSAAVDSFTVSVGTQLQTRRIVNVTDGRITDSSNDAVTGRQLYATNSKIGAIDGMIRTGQHSDAYALGAGSVTASAKSISVGSASNKRRIQYLADGTVAAGSSDAVTGNQLHATRQTLDGVKSSAESAQKLAQAASDRINDASLALGQGAKASGDSSVAVGAYAEASELQSTALGYRSKALGLNATALGYLAQATAAHTAAVGYGARALGRASLAFGYQSKAEHENSVALGGRAETTGTFQVSLGNATEKRKIVNMADGLVADGSHEAVTGSQLFRTNAAAEDAGKLAVAVHDRIDATTLALGKGAVAEHGSYGISTALGNNAKAYNGQSIAVGYDALSGVDADGKKVTGQNAGVSIGASTRSANGAVAAGFRASATGNFSIAVGGDAKAAAEHGTAVGYLSKASASQSTALGRGSEATAQFATASGNLAKATAISAVALGDRAQATHENAVALGAGAVTASSNSVSVGSASRKRKIQYVADGAVSAGSTDAITGNQLHATNQAVTRAQTVADAATTTANAAKVSADKALADAGVLGGLVGQVADNGNVRLGEKNSGMVLDVRNSANANRKVTGVADGALSSTSYEAVNGRQLSATNDKVATVEGVATSAGADAAVAKADAVKALVETAALGGLVAQVSASGDVRLGGKNSGTMLDVRNSTNANRKISGVANGAVDASSTEAVSGRQLYATNSRISDLESANQYLSVGVDSFSVRAEAALLGVALGDSAKAGAEGGTALGAFAGALGKNSVAVGRGAGVSGEASGGFAMGVGAQVYAVNGIAIGAGTVVEESAPGSLALGAGSFADEGGTASFGNATVQRRLTNIASGTADHNATTVSQLKDSLATLGGGAGIDASGNIIDPTYAVQSGTQNTVEDALMALDGAVITSSRRVDKVEGQLSSIFQDSPSARADGMNQIALNGVNGMVLTNLADGRVAPGSRDAVTGSQLYAAEQKISQNRNDLEAMRKEREMGEQAMRGLDASVIDYGGARLTGVAEAKLSADSSDVVRGSQLFSTNIRLAVVESKAEYFDFGSSVPELEWRAPRAGRAGVAIGEAAVASPLTEGAVAVGFYATAHGENSVALGRAAWVQAGADHGFALGTRSAVEERGGIALGAGSLVRKGALNSVAVGNSSVADESQTVSFGAGFLQRRLVNIANGTANHNAATVGQLRGALSALGGEVDANGNIVGPSFNVQGQSQSTLNGALEALDGAVVSTTSRVNQVESQLRSVFQETPSVRADGTHQLTLAGANGMVISNVANGLIAAGSRDVVNGGQLHSMQQQLNGRMDGLEQRIDDQPQARAMAAASTPSPSTEEIAPTPETSGSPQIASTGEGDKPTPQPKSKQDDTPKPQVDTADLEKMLARANEYTDGAISNFERRLDKMDKRFNRMAAMSSAQSAMAMNTAGLATYNRLGAGVGYSEGESAMAVGYQRVLNEKGSATFSLNGAFTNSGERSMGVGVGIGW
ncbi:hemagluttinin domain-containing protein [Stenotrophomonas maltophilia]|uniref:ESPR-type extended signal peptide-containing protein n=1 Tax=Stenotrophomonas maltophilia TaxID=40324 RepID=UPI0010760BEE|nr:ESPR-type extended signal peptide-containing protein [Stenotrophomonas maltophilia]TFZ43656.1 hemagluttinin domain-containing protein [Stenotrophomonas maltophilia]